MIKVLKSGAFFTSAGVGAVLVYSLLPGCGADATDAGTLSPDGATATTDASSDANAPGPGSDAGPDPFQGTDDASSDAMPTVVMGGPGCGFANAAFCDTFDAPAPRGPRTGELLSASWSASRLSPAGATSNGRVFPIGPATLRAVKNGTMLPACRAGMAALAFPPDDTRICNASNDIQSPHLLVAAAAQNYGENSYRIRQPFDFANRVGTIAFDAEAYVVNSLLGWVSIEVTDDPIPVPGFAQLGNFEGTAIPRNGFELHFSNNNDCASVGILATFTNYVETDTDFPNPSSCATASAWGHLNRFQVKVSQTLIEVFGTPFSANGTTFGAPVKIFSSPVNLPFSRGYVHLTVHNHATEKYWATYGAGFQNLDSWVARFDNVGFDGPVIGNFRESEVAPPLPAAPPTTLLDTGWVAPDKTKGTSGALKIPGVVRTGYTRARIALTGWYCMNCGPDPSTFVLHYRLNGGAWHDRKLTAGELVGLSKGSGAASQMLDVPMNELVDGDNTVEFATTNVPQNYPPGVANIDLILDKGP